jgi:ATP-dependent Clp protease ATP-binding subunit ClpB
VEIQLRRVVQLLEGRGIHLQVDQAAREYLADVGYDPNFGARPLKRAIQRELQDPLALEILSGSYPQGSTIRVEASPDGLIFIQQGETELVEN